MVFVVVPALALCHIAQLVCIAISSRLECMDLVLLAHWWAEAVGIVPLAAPRHWRHLMAVLLGKEAISMVDTVVLCMPRSTCVSVSAERM
jgi:hypothetical protein